MPNELRTIIALVIASASLFFHPSPSFGQTGDDPAVADEETSDADQLESQPEERGAAAEAEESSDLEEARRARDEGRYSEALDAISRAQLSDPDNGLYIYERVLILEGMKEYDLALKLIADRRESLIKHPDVNDLVVVEERIKRKSNSTEKKVGNDVGSEKGTKGETGSFPILGTVLTGTGAVVVTASAIVYFIQSGERTDLENCTIADIDCAPGEFSKRLDRANSLRTVSLVGGAIGVGLVGWGLFELFTHEPGGEDESEPEKEVSLSPYFGAGGGGIILEATF